MSTSVNISKKKIDFAAKFRKSRFRFIFSKNSNISIIWISINIFEKNSISVQNFENLDFGQHFRKNSISLQNFNYLDFGQHSGKSFDFGSNFRKSLFRSTFSKKFRFRWKIRKSLFRSTFSKKNRFRFKITKISISINIFEKKNSI